MELFQVTLKRGEDIQAFYDDMETPGGDLHIPDRKIDVGERRPTSRTTGYMLTLEEAQASVRFSVGHTNTTDEVLEAAEAILAVL